MSGCKSRITLTRRRFDPCLRNFTNLNPHALIIVECVFCLSASAIAYIPLSAMLLVEISNSRRGFCHETGEKSSCFSPSHYQRSSIFKLRPWASTNDGPVQAKPPQRTTAVREKSNRFSPS